MTFDHPQGLVITGGDRHSNNILNENSEEQYDQEYARSTHFVPAASQMVLHEEGDPNKKTMDFPVNANKHVPFFETELKPEAPPTCVMDIEISNTGGGGALSPMQNSKLSRMINESIVVAGDNG